MEHAFELLMHEHRIIERTLDAMEDWVKKVTEQQTDDRQELRRFVAFIRNFADRCHHGKEEDILFATMTEHGFVRDSGPLGVMLKEHGEGRALATTLDKLASQTTPWKQSDRDRLAAAVRSYVDLLRAHIAKEDRVLYPMAQNRLPAEVTKRLEERFERFEEAEMGNGEHERLHSLAESLIAAHLPRTKSTAS